MKLFLSILILLLSLLIAFSACAPAMTISGRVAVAGHEPFTYVRLLDRDQVEYKLIGPNAKILRQKYQQSLITLQGRVVKEAVGPGYPAEFEVVKIIEEDRD